uniref:Uncharacterized protein n=1 Tax=Anguilla anguilla TaxID=7936 RepID=A0A0E9SW43_ANGAN
MVFLCDGSQTPNEILKSPVDLKGKTSQVCCSRYHMPWMQHHMGLKSG